LPRLLTGLRRRVPGTAVRLAVAGTTVVAGLGIAVLTLPAVDTLQDHVSAAVGVDRR
jgi:hypothetical protein